MKKAASVLIIEDDPWLAEQHARLLKTEGYFVTRTSSAIEAIDAIENNIPNVILLDILLPGITGIALLHELQSYQDTAVISVILCSSLADQIQLEDMRPYGVRRILDKTTMVPDDVIAAIRSVL